MGKERAALEGVVATIDALTQWSEDVEMLVSLAVEGEDEETFHEAETELDALEKKLVDLEFRRMFAGQHDASDCYMDIQSGSGDRKRVV